MLFLDAPSGIAGDMTVAALVDLGVPFSEVRRAVGSLDLEGCSLELGQGFAGAIAARRFLVQVDDGQPERTYAAIVELLNRADLREGVRDLACAMFRRLAEAEAQVHGVPIESVHFHEVGAVDAIADIVGAAVCFEYVGATVVASPLPLGRGSVRCRHGVIPLPAPATLSCLRGVPTYDSGLDAELVTPTGAAIVATAATDFRRWPSMRPERVGWGMGTQRLPDRPNALRAVLGSAWRAEPPGTGGSSAATHVVVESNVDDLTGELAGHALSALMHEGALDAWITPILMKKGRPGIKLSALCPVGDADRIGAALLRETSTLGFRKLSATRTERRRRVVTVDTDFGRVPVKVSECDEASPQLKPEFDVCARLARERDVAVRDVLTSALVEARRQFVTEPVPAAAATEPDPGDQSGRSRA